MLIVSFLAFFSFSSRSMYDLRRAILGSWLGGSALKMALMQFVVCSMVYGDVCGAVN